jgi:protein kinase-like protein
MLDGETVDWDAAQARITTSEGRALASALRTLSALDSRLPLPALHSRVSRRMSPVLEVARGLSVGVAAIGLLGSLLALTRPPDAAGTAVRLAVLVAFGCTALALDLGGRDRRSRTLAGAYWAIAAAFSARGILTLAAYRSTTSAVEILQFVRPEVFLPAFMWYFARDFPRSTRFSDIDRVCGVAARLALILAVALFAVNLIPLVGPSAAIGIQPWVRLPGGGPWFWTVVFGCTIPALFMMAWRGRHASRDETNRVRLFLYGIAAGLGPVAIQVVVESLSPRFDAFTSSPSGHFWGSWVVYPPLLGLPALTAYTVAVGDVLDIRVVIQHALRYLLAKWLLLWAAGSSLIVLTLFVYQHRGQPVGAVLGAPEALTLLSIGAAAATMLLLRPRVEKALERWVVPDAQAPSVILGMLAARLKSARTPLEIARTLAGAAELALQTSVDVLLVKEGRLCATLPGSPPPPADSLIPVLVTGARGPCVMDDRHAESCYALLTEDDRAWIDAQQVAVIVPVLAGQSWTGLTAVICVKHRRTALGFSRDDVRFLAAAAGSAALASEVSHDSTDDALAQPDPRHDELARQCAECGVVDALTQAALSCSCGGQWEVASLPKDLLRRFTVERLLGAGGMGVVYRATDQRLGRSVALKTLTHLHPLASERLIVEARNMAALSHPHIAVLYGTELWRSTPVLIIEYLPQGTLAARLKRAPLAIDVALRLMMQLAAALEHLHRADVYHGDIKPSNIAFSADGTPKYLDFGLSRALDRSIQDVGPVTPQDSQRSGIGGTLPYLSPEVLNGAEPGAGLDLWALCVVFYECLTGTHPFVCGGGTQARIAEGLQKRRVDPLITGPLGAWFIEALAADPARRPRSASELSESVSRLLHSTR